MEQEPTVDDITQASALSIVIQQNLHLEDLLRESNAQRDRAEAKLAELRQWCDDIESSRPRTDFGYGIDTRIVHTVNVRKDCAKAVQNILDR